ncbi:hypothetical protein Hanom_Chr12g01084361 [Helianthus anomalus]
MNDICYELSSLQDLACRGSWRSIIDKVARARTQSLLSKPYEHLIYLTYNTTSPNYDVLQKQSLNLTHSKMA